MNITEASVVVAISAFSTIAIKPLYDQVIESSYDVALETYGEYFETLSNNNRDAKTCLELISKAHVLENDDTINIEDGGTKNCFITSTRVPGKRTKLTLATQSARASYQVQDIPSSPDAS